MLHKQYKIYEASCVPFNWTNPNKYGIFYCCLAASLRNKINLYFGGQLQFLWAEPMLNYVLLFCVTNNIN